MNARAHRRSPWVGLQADMARRRHRPWVGLQADLLRHRRRPWVGLQADLLRLEQGVGPKADPNWRLP